MKESASMQESTNYNNNVFSLMVFLLCFIIGITAVLLFMILHFTYAILQFRYECGLAWTPCHHL